jgi:hypothetical protein
VRPVRSSVSSADRLTVWDCGRSLLAPETSVSILAAIRLRFGGLSPHPLTHNLL